MTDTFRHAVVAYADFLVYREQRRTKAAEAEQQNVRRTIDTEAVPAPVVSPMTDVGVTALPIVNEETGRAGQQSPAQNAERIT
jgi:hypothetical protein